MGNMFDPLSGDHIECPALALSDYPRLPTNGLPLRFLGSVQSSGLALCYLPPFLLHHPSRSCRCCFSSPRDVAATPDGGARGDRRRRRHGQRRRHGWWRRHGRRRHGPMGLCRRVRSRHGRVRRRGRRGRRGREADEAARPRTRTCTSCRPGSSSSPYSYYYTAVVLNHRAGHPDADAAAWHLPDRQLRQSWHHASISCSLHWWNTSISELFCFSRWNQKLFYLMHLKHRRRCSCGMHKRRTKQIGITAIKRHTPSRCQDLCADARRGRMLTFTCDSGRSAPRAAT